MTTIEITVTMFLALSILVNITVTRAFICLVKDYKEQVKWKQEVIRKLVMYSTCKDKHLEDPELAVADLITAVAKLSK